MKIKEYGDTSRKLLIAGIIGCILYVVGDFLYAATGKGQTTESVGMFAKLAYLEMPTWRMAMSILCGFVGTLLYYMGFHRMYGLLKARADRLGESADFPHEIGLFLGYPPEDVRCFMCDRNRDCKCVGCWRAYNNETEAEKTFARFKKCTDVYCRKLSEGYSLGRLTVGNA